MTEQELTISQKTIPSKRGVRVERTTLVGPIGKQEGFNFPNPDGDRPIRILFGRAAMVNLALNIAYPGRNSFIGTITEVDGIVHKLSSVDGEPLYQTALSIFRSCAPRATRVEARNTRPSRKKA
jgi:hypothetical protein